MQKLEKNSRDKVNVNKQQKELFIIKPYEAMIITYLSTILFTITGIWQLIVISGFLGGFFCQRARMGLIIGFLGVFLAWISLFLFYSLTTEMIFFFQFWLVETMGYSLEILYIIMLVSSFMGGIIGALGGINGTFIKQILLKHVLSRYF
ncbi:MAG: hypothetical protein EU547_05230 [Promethearchaeota archaeon]|nr:MAG: hypothetical protein EU547_05230 [Candidatus Lokiarchaeota archaeon]